jgi:hypothetical protein
VFCEPFSSTRQNRQGISFSDPLIRFPSRTCAQINPCHKRSTAKGGLQKPTSPGDFRIDDWLPFVAENADTGQLVPITGLPTLGAPNPALLQASIIAAVVSFFLIALGVGTVTVGFSSLVTVSFVAAAIMRARNYKLGLTDAFRRAVATAV